MENTVDPDQMLSPEDNWSRSTLFSNSFVLFHYFENPDKLWMYDFNKKYSTSIGMENTVDPDHKLTPEDIWSRSKVYSNSFVLFNNLENPDKLIWFTISINSIRPIFAWKTLQILIRCFHQKTTDLDLQCHLFCSII